MSVLKNRIIKVFAIFWALPLCSAHAQILNMGTNFEKLDLPEEFLQNLEKCTPYSGEKPYQRNAVKVNTTYQIIGLKNNLCVVKIDGSTNTSVNIHQECHLPPQTAATYAQALRRYQSRGYSPRWDGEWIEKNKDYQTALKIMSDTSLCRFYRDKIDYTQDIRDNLPNCQPSEQTETTAALKILRKIIGKDGDKCHYQMTVQHANPQAEEPLVKNLSDNDENAVPKHLALTFDCSFDSEQIAHYLQILEALVIPAEEGFDYSAVQRVSQQEETDFVMNNCILNTSNGK